MKLFAKLLKKYEKYFNGVLDEETPEQCKKCDHVIYGDTRLFKFDKPKWTSLCTLSPHYVGKKIHTLRDYCLEKNPRNNCPKDLTKMEHDIRIIPGCDIAFNEHTTNYHCLKCHKDIPMEILAYEHVCDKNNESLRVMAIQSDLAKYKAKRS